MGDFVEVTTSAGVVRGEWKPTTGGAGASGHRHSRYASFRGIPIAEPPIGDLARAARTERAAGRRPGRPLPSAPTAQRGDPGITSSRSRASPATAP